MALTVSVIVCAHNEATYISACLHSVLAQTRPPNQIIVVDNASTDGTAALARQLPHVEVVKEPRKGLVIARESGRRQAWGDVLVYLDADCRAPLLWLDQILDSSFMRKTRTSAGDSHESARSRSAATVTWMLR